MKSTFYHGKLYDMIKEDNIHNCSECPENRNEVPGEERCLVDSKTVG